jgi:hypothetical protein
LPTLYNITNWNFNFWWNTGGTRNKKVIQNPDDNKFYWFKQSLKKQGKDYFFEFWSEIIATEIGQLLGFNVLRYDIAIDREVIGCISESMISENETLTEGGQYLRAYDNTFDPETKDGSNLYSFQLIENTLKEFKLSEHIEDIIELIIFDSIIGNGDRHLENWAFINKQTFLSQGLKEIERDFKTGLYKIPKLLQKLIIDTKKKEVKLELKGVALRGQQTKAFAPIFDNGSSLGRELDAEKIDRMLKNEQELLAYVNRGVSEIHWNSDKVKHIELIKKLLESSYSEITVKIIKRVIEQYDAKRIESIVMNIDSPIPAGKYEKYKLPDNRKLLILKLLTLRIEKLKLLLDERL